MGVPLGILLVMGKYLLVGALYVFVLGLFRALFGELAARRRAPVPARQQLQPAREPARPIPAPTVPARAAEPASPAVSPPARREAPQPRSLAVRPEQPCLVVVRSPDPAELAPGAHINLRAECSLGRNRDNDVVLPDRYATGHHAVIVQSNGQRRVRDQGSANGTFVNGTRVDGEYELQNGDHLTLGKTEFRYQA